MSFYSEEELQSLGFARCGKQVKISKKTSIYNPANISIGDNVRIDDFCVISAGDGGIVIGDFVHVAIYSSMMGCGKITLEDFSGLSSRVSIYSSNDDYSGEYLTNPTVPSEYTGVSHGDVVLGKHVIIGSGTIILPAVTIGMGAAVGSLSLVKRNCDEFGIYIGAPAKRIGERRKNLLELENQLRQKMQNGLKKA